MLTDNDNESDGSHGYLFMVRPHLHHGLVLDRFIDVTPALGHSGPDDYDRWRRTALALFSAGSGVSAQTRAEAEKTLPTSKNLTRTIQSMIMRARMIGGDVHYLRSPEPLTSDELEDLLISMQRRGTLMDFLSGCRF